MCPFFNRSPKNPICTLSGIHTFVCVPLEHLEVFFSGSQILYKNNYPIHFANGYDCNYYNFGHQPVLFLCVTFTAVEIYQGPHTLHFLVLFVGEYHLPVSNLFLFHIFSGIFVPLRDCGWYLWMLSHRCSQAPGLSQQHHAQKHKQHSPSN